MHLPFINVIFLVILYFWYFPVLSQNKLSLPGLKIAMKFTLFLSTIVWMIANSLVCCSILIFSRLNLVYSTTSLISPSKNCNISHVSLRLLPEKEDSYNLSHFDGFWCHIIFVISLRSCSDLNSDLLLPLSFSMPELFNIPVITLK